MGFYGFFYGLLFFYMGFYILHMGFSVYHPVLGFRYDHEAMMQLTQAAVHLAKDWPFSGGFCGVFFWIFLVN